MTMRINYTLIKMLENPGVNALLKAAKRTWPAEGYQGITFEQVAQLAAEAGYGPETAALTYQSIKAVAKLPSDRLERLLRRRKMGQVLEFREDT